MPSKPKEAHRKPQMAPRSIQKAPGSFNGRPQEAPRKPQAAPRKPKKVPGSPQKAPDFVLCGSAAAVHKKAKSTELALNLLKGVIFLIFMRERGFSLGF